MIPLPSGTFRCTRTGETYEIVSGHVVSVADGPGTSTWGLG